ncbi:MAG: acyltransferase [Adhaeribacter sp.]
MEIVTIDTNKQSLRQVRLGKDVKIFDFVNAYGCSIGDGSQVGAFVEIQQGASIGKNCKISSHTFICEGVHLADQVFVGHNVTFINDKFPRATKPDGTLQGRADWQCVETYVEEGASIGSSVTVLCGVRIGKRAIVGAGSVVTRDVPDHAVVAGNPARIIRYPDQQPVGYEHLNHPGENRLP